MTEDARHAAVLALLAEHGTSSPEVDSDTLATKILKAVDDAGAEAPADEPAAETPAP